MPAATAVLFPGGAECPLTGSGKNQPLVPRVDDAGRTVVNIRYEQDDDLRKLDGLLQSLQEQRAQLLE